MTTSETEMIKRTPVAYAQRASNPKMGELHGMEVALAFEGASIETARKSVLGVTDVSCFQRFSVKGPQAAAWLESQGLKLPAEINSWVETAPGTLALRLGGSEFLIEDQFSSKTCSRLHGFNQAAVPGAYQVQRADAAFILSGREVLNLLSELCMLDLRDSALAGNAVVMTQVAGISATLLRQQLNGQQVYRVWCDGTYGPYMWDMLLEIAKELGGGAVGLSCHFK
ncbi:sarcosine oxidase, subunit gamma [Methylophilaceae bacterium]|nr:sarcosine oxidase, subunit gamma [Methylophilaceae bacterium]